MKIVPVNWLHGIAIALMVGVIGAASIKPRTPQSDEYVYLGYAYGLAKYGTFGLVSRPSAGISPEPSSLIAPLVPAIHALAMSMSPRFLDETKCLLAKRPAEGDSCTHTSIIPNVIQLLLWSLCLAWVAAQIGTISRQWSLAYLVTGFILVSGALFEYINQFNSEGIYLPVFFVFLTAFARGFTEDSLRHWILAATALAVCTLTRPVFFYLFCLLVPLFILAILVRRRDSTMGAQLRGLAVFALVFSVVIGPWIVRNIDLYGKPTLTVGYGVQSLYQRIAYNGMTPAEYRAGWIYWLPDFGDSLARRLFEPSSYRRLDLGYAHGFYREGARMIREDIEKRTGLPVSNYAQGDPRVEAGWIFREYILGDWFTHLKVTTVLFWRGVMLNSYFGMVGLILMVWAIATGISGLQRPVFLVTVTVTTLLSLFYAFVSLNIARYSAPMILPMSMAYAALADRIIKRVQDCNAQSLTTLDDDRL